MLLKTMSNFCSFDKTIIYVNQLDYIFLMTNQQNSQQHIEYITGFSKTGPK